MNTIDDAVLVLANDQGVYSYLCDTFREAYRDALDVEEAERERTNLALIQTTDALENLVHDAFDASVRKMGGEHWFTLLVGQLLPSGGYAWQEIVERIITREFMEEIAESFA